MASQIGDIKIDPAVLEEQAKTIVRCREDINRYLRECHSAMEEVNEAMQSDAGARIVERFNNLVNNYYERYANSMAAHATYLDDIATRYREDDATLKSKADSALTHFDNV